MSVVQEQAVLTDQIDGILVITMNRPRVRNAINVALARGVAQAFDRLDADPDLVAGVLTGAAPCFSAGMDLKAFVAGEQMWEGEGDDLGMRRVVTRGARKPMLAAIEGFAVAGGLELALACDILVAGRSARFGIPEVQRSIIAGGGALRRIPQRTGPGVAMKLALTGDLVDGDVAQRIGLVDEVAEDGQALETAVALAQAIGRNGPLAVAATKAILQSQADWTEAEFWARQQEITDPVLASEDAREGSRAFSEKRDPVWSGR
jgi:enoyl-CoA hydratase